MTESIELETKAQTLLSKGKYLKSLAMFEQGKINFV